MPNQKELLEDIHQFHTALEAYIKPQCSDLKLAESWIHNWAKEGQTFPNLPAYKNRMASCKWMAAFVSTILEGKPVEKTYEGFQQPRYFETKFGYQLWKASQVGLNKAMTVTSS